MSDSVNNLHQRMQAVLRKYQPIIDDIKSAQHRQQVAEQQATLNQQGYTPVATNQYTPIEDLNLPQKPTDYQIDKPDYQYSDWFNDALTSMGLGATSLVGGAFNMSQDMLGALDEDVSLKPEDNNTVRKVLSNASKLALQQSPIGLIEKTGDLVGKALPDGFHQAVANTDNENAKLLSNVILGTQAKIDKNKLVNQTHQSTGLDSIRQSLNDNFSPVYKAKQQEINKELNKINAKYGGNVSAESLWEGVLTVASDPYYASQAAIQSVPSMLLGIISKNPAVVFPILEALSGNDEAVQQVRANGLDLNKPAVRDYVNNVMIASGAITAISGGLSNRLGLGNVDNFTLGSGIGRTLLGTGLEALEEASIAGSGAYAWDELTGEKKYNQDIAQAIATSAYMQAGIQTPQAIVKGATALRDKLPTQSDDSLTNPQHKNYNPAKAFMQAHEAGDTDKAKTIIKQTKAYHQSLPEEQQQEFYTKYLEPINQTIIALSNAENTGSFSTNISKATNTASKPSIAIGDSIANGFATANGITNLGVVGESPSKILNRIKALKANDVQGKSIILSSGLSNNLGEYKLIREQIKHLKSLGVSDIKLMGVANDFQGSKTKGEALNSVLSKIAQAEKITFLGGFDSADNAKVHPNNSYYTGLFGTNKNQETKYTKPVKVTGNVTPTKHRKLTNDSKYDDLMYKAYSQFGFTPDEMIILKTQIAQESNYNPNATGIPTKWGTAKGIAQFIDATAQAYGLKNPYDPYQSFVAQAKYMRKLLNDFNGNWDLALGAYNSGEHKPEYKKGYLPNISETKKYVANILAHVHQHTLKGHSYQGNTNSANNSSTSSTEARTGFTDVGSTITPDTGLNSSYDDTEQSTDTENQEQKPRQETKKDDSTKYQIFRAYSTAKDEELSEALDKLKSLVSNGFISDDEATALVRLLEVKQKIKGLNSNEVREQILYGKDGQTDLETNLGITHYLEAFSTGDTELINTYSGYLDRFTNDHISKAKAIKDALADYDGTPIQLAYFKDKNKWMRTSADLDDSYRKFTVSTNTANKTMNSIFEEAEILSEFRDSVQSFIKGSTNKIDSPISSQEANTEQIKPESTNSTTDSTTKPSNAIQSNTDTNTNTNPDGFHLTYHPSEKTSLSKLHALDDSADAFKGMFVNPFNIYQSGKRNGYHVDSRQEALDKYTNNFAGLMKTKPNLMGKGLDKLKQVGFYGHKNREEEKSIINQFSKLRDSGFDFSKTKAQHFGYVDGNVVYKGTPVNELYQDTNTSTTDDVSSNHVHSTSNDTNNTTSKLSLKERLNQAVEQETSTEQESKPENKKSREVTVDESIEIPEDYRSKVSSTSKHKKEAVDYVRESKSIELVSQDKEAIDLTTGNHSVLNVVNVIGLDDTELFIGKAIAKVYNQVTVSFDGTDADIMLDKVSPSKFLKALVEYSTNEIVETIAFKPKLNKKEQALKDELDLVIARLNQVKEHVDDTKLVNFITKVTDNTDYQTLISVGLSNQSVKALLKQVQTVGKARKSLFTVILSGLKSFLGIPNKENVDNLYERLVSVTGNLIDIQSKDNKSYQIFSNTDYFKQGNKTNLSNIANLVQNIYKDIDYLDLLDIKLNDIQKAQLEHFIGFHSQFVKNIKASYAQHSNIQKDFKAVLNKGTKDNPEFDNNLLTAISLVAYNHTIVNGGSVYSSSEDILTFLGLDDSIELPYSVYSYFKHYGKAYNGVVADLGKAVYDVLDIKAIDGLPEANKGRLQSSLGTWVLSAMQTANMVYINELSGSDYKQVRALLTDDSTDIDDNAVVKAVSFTTPDGHTNPIINAIVDKSKGTNSSLDKIFGSTNNKRYPHLKPVDKVNRNIFRTNAKVTDKQAEYIKQMQSEPIVLNQDMYQVVNQLKEQDYEFLLDIIGASVSDEQLAKSHVSSRDSMLAKADGIKRELDNYFDWVDALGDISKEFYDTISVKVNDRMHYDSNVFNFQSSKVHRALGELKSFKTTFDIEELDPVKNKELGLFIKAIFENAEGTEDIIEKDLKPYNLFTGFTVDKVEAKLFLPSAWNYLTTNADVAKAVEATKVLLDNKELNQEQKEAISKVVSQWDMGMQSLRALMELTKLFKAIENKDTKFTTSLGLGSDGINNGTAIGFALLAVDNITQLAGVGILKTATGLKNWFETRSNKNIGDYYSGLIPLLEVNINTPEQLAFQTINNTLLKRKTAKAILIPFGYGASIARLVIASANQMYADFVKQLETIANNNDREALVRLQEAIKVVLPNFNYDLTKVDDLKQLLELQDNKLESALKDAYIKTMYRPISNAITSYAQATITKRESNIAIHEAMNSLYMLARNVIENQVEKERLAELRAKYPDDKEYKEAVKYETLSKEQRIEKVDKVLESLLPKIHSSYSLNESIANGFELLTTDKTLVHDDSIDNRSYMYVGNNELRLKSLNSLISAIKLVSSGVRTFAQQIQHVDSHISAIASTYLNKISINVHDANIGALSHHEKMAYAQNKAFFDITSKYHLNQVNVKSLTDMINNFNKLNLELSNDDLTDIVYSMFRGFIKNNTDNVSAMTLLGIPTLTAVKSLVINSAIANLQADIDKLSMYLETGYIHQYGGENGQYKLTDEDRAFLTKERDKLVKESNAVITGLESALDGLELPVSSLPKVHYIDEPYSKKYEKRVENGTVLLIDETITDENILSAMLMGVPIIAKNPTQAKQAVNNILNRISELTTNRDEHNLLTIALQNQVEIKVVENLTDVPEEYRTTIRMGGAYFPPDDNYPNGIVMVYSKGATEHDFESWENRTMYLLSHELVHSITYGNLTEYENQLDEVTNTLFQEVIANSNVQLTDAERNRLMYAVSDINELMSVIVGELDIQDKLIQLGFNDSIVKPIIDIYKDIRYAVITERATKPSQRIIDSQGYVTTSNYAPSETSQELKTTLPDNPQAQQVTSIKQLNDLNYGKTIVVNNYPLIFLGFKTYGLLVMDKQGEYHKVSTKDKEFNTIMSSLTGFDEYMDETNKINVYWGTNENKELSNLALRPFTYKDNKYYSVEHAYQSLKTGRLNPVIYNDTRWSKAGTKIHGGVPSDNAVALMEELMYESFKQNDNASNRLLNTGLMSFTHRQDLSVWNYRFPMLLEKVRTRLRADKHISIDDIYNALPTGLTEVHPVKMTTEYVRKLNAINPLTKDTGFHFGHPNPTGNPKADTKSYLEWVLYGNDERATSIRELLSSGKLDGKQVLTIKTNEINHANALQYLVDNWNDIKQGIVITPIETKESEYSKYTFLSKSGNNHTVDAKVLNSTDKDYIIFKYNDNYVFGIVQDGVLQHRKVIADDSIDTAREALKELQTSKVILSGNTKYTAKDQTKSNKANKFIGFGAKGSSTDNYANDWGKLANTGNYVQGDVVFVSVNGNRKGAIPITDKRYQYELSKAIDANVTFITDGLVDRQREFNTGERALADYLTKHGYKDNSTGIWTKTNDTKPINLISYLSQVTEANYHITLVSKLLDIFPKAKDITVQLVHDTQTNKDKTGWFENNTITLNTLYPTDVLHRTLAHELVHALTLNQLGKSTKAEQELSKIYHYLMSVKTYEDNIPNFMLENLAEFIAYGLTEPTMYKFIDKYLTTTALKELGINVASKSKLQAFIDIVADFFKIKKTGFKAISNLVLELANDDVTSKGTLFSTATLSDTFKTLSTGNISTGFNKQLDKLIDAFISPFNTLKTVNPSDSTISNESVLYKLGMSEKESYVAKALSEVLSIHMNANKGNLVVNNLDKLYQNSAKAFKSTASLFTQYHTVSNEEQQRLNALFNYVFRNKTKEENVARFISMVLANEEFSNAISKHKPIYKDLDESLFDSFMHASSDLTGFLLGKFNDNKNIKQQTHTYVKQLHLLVNKHNKNKLDKLQHWYEVSQAKTYQYLDVPILKGIHAITRLPFVRDFDIAHLIGDVIDINLMTANDSNKILNNLFTDWLMPKGDSKLAKSVADIVSELGQYGKRGEMINRLTMVTSNIALTRQRIKASMIKTLNGFFDTELTTEQKSSITYGLLRTDLSALLTNGYTTKQVLDFLKPSNRQQEVDKLKTKLKGYMNDTFEYRDTLHQINALARYMVLGEVEPAMVKNSYSIASGFGAFYFRDEVPNELVTIVDSLVSLRALDYVKENHITHLNQLDKKSLISTMLIHKELVERSKDEFRHNPINYVKGYLPEITNPNKKLVFASTQEQQQQLIDKGFKVLYELDQDVGDDSPQKVLMYHDSYIAQERVSGALDLYDTHSKGETIISNKDIDKLTAKLQSDINYRNERAKGLKPEYNKSVLIASYDTDGAINGYHYEMLASTRDKYLERNNDFDLLLGVLGSSLVYKKEIKEHQRTIARELVNDSKQGYITKPSEYILLDFKSTDKDVQSLMKVLPYAFVQELRKHSNGKTVPIHRSIFNAIFGFDVLTLAQTLDTDSKPSTIEYLLRKMFTGIFHENALRNAVVIEQSIQRLMQIIKQVIVVRTGTTLLFNILSNTLLLSISGVNPLKVLQDTLFAWSNAKKYVNDINKLEEVKLKIIATRDTKSLGLLKQQEKSLTEALNRNPLKEYMDKGLMSTIVEDTDTQKNHVYKTVLDKKIDKVRSKTNKYVLKAFDTLAINDGTFLHDFLNEATQFSDFSAKYVLAKHLQTKGYGFDDSIHEASLHFINYDIPTNKYIDYLNRVGLLMFTKFFLRFQNVLTRLATKLPSRVLSQHIMAETLGLQGVLDPFWLNQLGNPFDNSLLNGIEVADDLITTSLLF